MDTGSISTAASETTDDAITPLVTLDQTLDQTATQAELEEALNLREADAEAAIGAFGDVATTTNMPTVGTASYSGAIAFVEGSTPPSSFEDDVDYDVSADLALAADFGASTVSGVAGNFISEDGDDDFVITTGSVPLTGTISGAALTASGNGTLSNRFDQNFATELTLNGDFAGTNADAVRGQAQLTAASDGSDSESYGGLFIATQ